MVASPFTIEIPTQASGTWSLFGNPLRGAGSVDILAANSMLVGRLAHADLQLQSQFVSGEHARLSLIDNRLVVSDLGSTNGTYVNRNRISGPTQLHSQDHLAFADVEYQIVRRESRNSHTELPSKARTAPMMDAVESNWTLSGLDLLISQREIVSHFQPIVHLASGQILGYESFSRSSVPGLGSAGSMLRAAEVAGRAAELSAICRECAVDQARGLPRRTTIFLNLHASERFDAQFYAAFYRLRQLAPVLRLTIELNQYCQESAELRKLSIDQFRALGIDVAYKGFGAGPERILELTHAPPKYVKLHPRMIRRVADSVDVRKRLLSQVKTLTEVLGIQLIATGIETQRDFETCTELKIPYGQGLYCGAPRPAAAIPKGQRPATIQSPARVSGDTQPMGTHIRDCRELATK